MQLEPLLDFANEFYTKNALKPQGLKIGNFIHQLDLTLAIVKDKYL